MGAHKDTFGKPVFMVECGVGGIIVPYRHPLMRHCAWQSDAATKSLCPQHKPCKAFPSLSSTMTLRGHSSGCSSTQLMQGTDPLWAWVMSTPTPKLGLLTPKGFPGKIAWLLHHPLSFSPPMAFGDNVLFLPALPASQALHFFPASSCLTEFL